LCWSTELSLLGSLYRRYAETIDPDGDEAVLEFDCGSGGIGERLAPRLCEGWLTCVDISPPMVRIAAQRMEKYDNVRCLVGRIEDLALREGSFDTVVIRNALHDVTEAERASIAIELLRMLKPGGKLCLREPTKPSYGLPLCVYRALLTEAGLSEVRFREHKVFPIGPVFAAVFVKRG
jgi:ubiquinone/menaquinone biosynthesis C-methylase UbiE